MGLKWSYESARKVDFGVDRRNFSTVIAPTHRGAPFKLRLGGVFATASGRYNSQSLSPPRLSIVIRSRRDVKTERPRPSEA
jgi:hypothetical protein